MGDAQPCRLARGGPGCGHLGHVPVEELGDAGGDRRALAPLFAASAFTSSCTWERDSAEVSVRCSRIEDLDAALPVERRLLTRDADRYRSYLPGVTLMAP